MDGLDNEISAAIGEITFAYSELESTLALHTWCLIDPARLRTGMVITAGMDFWKLVETFAALVIDKNDPDDESIEAQQICDRLRVLLSKIEMAREERNRIAHSSWLTTEAITVTGDDPKSIILRVEQSKDQKKGWHVQFEAWMLDRFRAVLEDIRNAKEEISAFAGVASELKRLFPQTVSLNNL